MRPGEEAIEALTRGPHAQGHALRRRHPGALDGLGADVVDQRRERDLHRTHGVAGVAAETHVLLVRDGLDAVVPRREHQSDRAGVDVPEHVAADNAIRGTDGAARATADATERIAESGILSHRGAAVVQQHDVDFLRTVYADGERLLDVC